MSMKTQKRAKRMPASSVSMVGPPFSFSFGAKPPVLQTHELGVELVVHHLQLIRCDFEELGEQWREAMVCLVGETGLDVTGAAEHAIEAEVLVLHGHVRLIRH